LDLEHRFVRINPELAVMNGLPVEAHIGRSVQEVLPGIATAANAKFSEVAASGRPVRDYELQGETPAQPGVRRTWLENYYPVRGTDGAVRGVGTIVREITAERASGEALRRSEQRARQLLEEAHHRTKNNLQVISSLILLMRREESDAGARERLDGLNNRLLAFASVHEQLYVAGASAQVHLGTLLNGLLDQLERTVSGGTIRRDDLSCDFMVSTEQAMTLAVAVNELVTNAVKHGGGRVEVRCRAVDQSIRMDVQDSGPGFPPGLDVGALRSLGLRLIAAMAERAGGRLVVCGNRATVTVLQTEDAVALA
jgi:two-component sensor histidine kinase